MQVHIYYSGRVQGVGFRYRTQEIARMMNISGWVKNLPDGRVEIAAQSERKVLEEFIERLEGAMAFYITNHEVIWKKQNDNFKGFMIRF